MRDGLTTVLAASVALACASTLAGEDAPAPALLEFLGATAAAEDSGIDVDRLIDALRLRDRDDRVDERVDDEPEEET